VILHQFYLNCLAHASYLIGDRGSGTAAIVDPQRDVEAYLAMAAEHGLEDEPRRGLVFHKKGGVRVELVWDRARKKGDSKPRRLLHLEVS